MLYLQFNMSLSIQESLQELDEARDEISPYAQLPDEYTGQLRRHALAQTVHFSTQIEGNTLTLEQVESLIRGDRISAPRSQVQEANNYREAMNYIQSIAFDSNFVITEDTIRAVHYLISKDLPGFYAAGRYRTEQNYVVDRITTRRIFIPPAAGDLAGLMKEFIDWYHSDTRFPTPIRAALVHLNIVAIHPFFDGNGRTARVLDSLALYGGGFKSQELVSLEAYFGGDNRAYYEALAMALGPSFTSNRDVGSWVEYYLRAHVEQANAAIQRVSRIVAELDYFQERFGPAGLTPPQIIGLWLASDTGRITNRGYRSISDRSAQSAAADLTKLVKNGLLMRTGRGRASAYIPSRQVNEALEEIRRQRLNAAETPHGLDSA